jgi:hypothetical protein
VLILIVEACPTGYKALSNIIKAKDQFLPRLLNRYDVDDYVFCYSPFSILDIKKSQFLYENFCEVFSLLPSFLLKGYFDMGLRSNVTAGNIGAGDVATGQ